MCGWGTDDSDTHGACNGLAILAGGAADCTSHNYTDPFVWVPAILVMDGMGSMCQFPLSLITVIDVQGLCGAGHDHRYIGSQRA